MSPTTRRAARAAAASQPSTPVVPRSPRDAPDGAASPPREPGVRRAGDAWLAHAHVEGELRLLGRFEGEAAARRALEAATATQSAAASPAPASDKRATPKPPVRRTSLSVRPAVPTPPLRALSPPPPLPPPPLPPPPGRRARPLLLLLLLLLAAAAAVAWHLHTHARAAPAATPAAAAALAAPRCAAAPSLRALEALVPPSPAWRDWAASLAEELSAPRAASSLTHQKANVVLLVAPPGRLNRTSAAAASALRGAAEAALPRCAAGRRTLALRGGDFAGADARGALQAALVRFLRRCPGGLVLLHDVHALPGAALPALLPLLSEAGAYTADGSDVPASRAAVLLTARLRGYDAAWEAAGEEALSRGAKAALAAQLAAAGGGDEGAANVARALRRRVDAVAPLRRALRGDADGNEAPLLQTL